MNRILLSLLFLCTTLASAKSGGPRVRFETNVGDFVVELSDSTPIHRDNFLKLVNEGYYNGLLFHRVIPEFMIQAGDPDSRHAAPGTELGNGGPDYTLPAEFRIPALYHVRGALAAAREADEENPERRSSGSQFYIVTGRTFSYPQLTAYEEQIRQKTDSTFCFTNEMKSDYVGLGGAPFLDGQYTVFGRVVLGMRVVEAIGLVPRDKNDRPIEDVRILRAYVVQK